MLIKNDWPFYCANNVINLIFFRISRISVNFMYVSKDSYFYSIVHRVTDSTKNIINVFIKQLRIQLNKVNLFVKPSRVGWWLLHLESNKPVLTPHETNCGWYYVEREATGERVLNSCPMPQLFDISTSECKNYTEVKCKDRFEPKDACKYFHLKTSLKFTLLILSYRRLSNPLSCSFVSMFVSTEL